jgi:hypothetical protein
MVIPFFATMSSFLSHSHFRYYAISLACWGFYALAYFFWESLWGTHAWVFLPGQQGIILLLLSLLIILAAPYIASWYGQREKKGTSIPFATLSEQIFLTVLGGGAMYAFPIFMDFYGDASFIRPEIESQIETLPEGMLGDLFRLPLSSKIGTASFYILVNLGSLLMGKIGVEALIWMEAFMGMLFLFAWFQTVAAYLEPGLRRGLGYMLGMTAPFTQVFYGHMEIYAFEMIALMGYLSCLLLFFAKQKRGYLWGLIPLQVLCIKLHVTGALLLPVTVLVFVYVFTEKKAFFTPRKLFRYILIPIYLLGIIIYLFVTDSFFGERIYESDKLNEVIFLPFVAAEGPPLNRYNLMGFYHIWDFINLLFIWSGGALVLMLGSIMGGNVSWEKPALLFSMLAFGIYVPFFFVVNPLLSMPWDWDMMSLTAPLWLVVALLLFAQLKGSSYRFQLALGSAAICLLGLSFMVCNHQQSSLSHRLTSVGKHMFKTYWLGSSDAILYGIQLEERPQESMARRLEVLQELEAHAEPGNDAEYAALYESVGKLFIDQQNYPEALPYLEKAFSYKSDLISLPYNLVVAYFLSGNFAQAHALGDELIALQYPSAQKAHRMALHVSLEAAAYDDALYIAQQYLQRWPNDGMVNAVARELAAGENLDQVKRFFRQK